MLVYSRTNIPTVNPQVPGSSPGRGANNDAGFQAVDSRFFAPQFFEKSVGL